MAVTNRIRERKDRRLRLRVIRKNINKLGRGYLNGSDLKDAGVSRQIVSLEGKAALPRFFAPYNGKIDPPRDKEVLDYVNESFPRFDKLGIEHRAETAQRFLHKYIQHGELPQEEYWGNFGFPDLVEIRGKPTWQFMTAWDMPLHKQPHIKCMISTNIIAEDRLLYSEIVSILEVIRQRLRTPETRLHVDAPVFLYSFIDTSFRVLEGNFDGKKLIVRATKLYDLTDDDRKGYELSAHLTKWWYGDTTKRSTKRFTEKSTD
ncbi:hypothetical protein N8T08_003071 [Aspergillus melleus]|uniref:Uncharacterized protein n=1 Tax=Aspergillus melleus TaxID=138277 RepID=A0ACC3B6X9_9EURO|nr:hypothetical protein N8T08_003071 [Aspergillus melleus]